MSFGSDLRKIAKARNLDLEKISRTVPLRVFNAVVKDTRVDTGRLRGNWQVSKDFPIKSTSDWRQKTGGLRSTEAAKIAPFSLMIMTNNLPYAEVWEKKDAMVGRAVADFQRIVKQEAQAL